MFCFLLTLSCKVNNSSSAGQKNSNIKKTVKIEKKETMSCLEIKNNLKDHQNDNKYPFTKGKDKEALQKNCYSFYSKQWEKYIAGSENITEGFIRKNIDRWKKIIKNPELDVKIKSINNNIAVVSRSAFSHEYEAVKVEDIWVYRMEKWDRVHGLDDNVEYSVKLLHINNDEYIDAIVTGGCCDSSTINILLGDKDKVLILRQTLEITGMWGLEYKGRCNSRFNVKPYDAMVKEYGSRPKLAVFDCRKNLYVMKE